MAERVAEVRGRSDALNFRGVGGLPLGTAGDAAGCSVVEAIVLAMAAAI